MVVSNSTLHRMNLHRHIRRENVIANEHTHPGIMPVIEDQITTPSAGIMPLTECRTEIVLEGCDEPIRGEARQLAGQRLPAHSGRPAIATPGGASNVA